MGDELRRVCDKGIAYPFSFVEHHEWVDLHSWSHLVALSYHQWKSLFYELFRRAVKFCTKMQYSPLKLVILLIVWVDVRMLRWRCEGWSRLVEGILFDDASADTTNNTGHPVLGATRPPRPAFAVGLLRVIFMLTSWDSQLWRLTLRRRGPCVRRAGLHLMGGRGAGGVLVASTKLLLDDDIIVLFFFFFFLFLRCMVRWCWRERRRRESRFRGIVESWSMRGLRMEGNGEGLVMLRISHGRCPWCSASEREIDGRRAERRGGAGCKLWPGTDITISRSVSMYVSCKHTRQ